MNEPRGLVECANVPKSIAAIVASGKATLTELDTVYGIEDMWDLLEIITVESHNQRILNTPKD